MSLELHNIHFHDTKILSVFEDTFADTLIMSVDYPVDWENNIFEKRKIIFEDAYNYCIHEIPFSGSPTILDATVLEQRGRWTQVRLETNAGYREVCCTAVKLI